MNRKYLICTSIILVVVAIGIYIKQKQPTTNIITYYCQEGILKSQYGESYVTLTFPNGENILLPQTVSGSGIRYELGKTTFSSKGDNAFLTEGTTTTYTNCVSGNE